MSEKIMSEQEKPPGCTDDIIAELEQTIAKLITALHDAISQPKGVVPDSAVAFCGPVKTEPVSCRMNIEIDVIDWLEAGITLNPRFDFNDWAPGDTYRLKKIVEFLEQQEEDYRVEVPK